MAWEGSGRDWCSDLMFIWPCTASIEKELDRKSIWIQAEMSSSTSRCSPGVYHKSSMALKQNFGGKNTPSLFTVFCALCLCLYFLLFYSAYRTVSPQFDRAVYKSHAVTLRPFLQGLILNMEMLRRWIIIVMYVDGKWSVLRSKRFIVLKEPRGVG